MAGAHPIHRSIFSHWLWQDKPFTRGQAWVDLILLASFTDSKAVINGRVYNVKRGQVRRSKLSLGNRWGWSRDRVTRFLSVLEIEGMIKKRSGQHGTVVTLINYKRLHNQAFKSKSSGRLKHDSKSIHKKTQRTIQQEMDVSPNSGNRLEKQALSSNTPDDTRSTASNGQQTGHIQQGKQGKRKKAVTNLHTRDFIEWWFTQYEQRFGDKYYLRGKKDAGIVGRLLTQAPLEELKQRASMFLDSRDKFITTAGHTLGILESTFNQFRTNGNGRTSNDCTPAERMELNAINS